MKNRYQIDEIYVHKVGCFGVLTKYLQGFEFFCLCITILCSICEKVVKMSSLPPPEEVRKWPLKGLQTLIYQFLQTSKYPKIVIEFLGQVKKVESLAIYTSVIFDLANFLSHCHRFGL